VNNESEEANKKGNPRINKQVAGSKMKDNLKNCSSFKEQISKHPIITIKSKSTAIPITGRGGTGSLVVKALGYEPEGFEIR
jgi:hypothetical protein